MSERILYERRVDPKSGPFSLANGWVDDLIDSGLLVPVRLKEVRSFTIFPDQVVEIEGGRMWVEIVEGDDE